MKITITVDCSPEEARAFLGLPDLRPVHEALVGHLVKHVEGNLQSLTPESLVRAWLQPGVTGMETVLRAFAGPGPAGEGKP